MAPDDALTLWSLNGGLECMEGKRWGTWLFRLQGPLAALCDPVRGPGVGHFSGLGRREWADKAKVGKMQPGFGFLGALLWRVMGTESLAILKHCVILWK